MEVTLKMQIKRNLKRLRQSQAHFLEAQNKLLAHYLVSLQKKIATHLDNHQDLPVALYLEVHLSKQAHYLEVHLEAHYSVKQAKIKDKKTLELQHQVAVYLVVLNQVEQVYLVSQQRLQIIHLPQITIHLLLDLSLEVHQLEVRSLVHKIVFLEIHQKTFLHPNKPIKEQPTMRMVMMACIEMMKMSRQL